jgi:uncharacterized protein
MKSRNSILQSRWLRPFAHLFSHPALWQLSRRSVPRALAVGLFAAFIIPVGQFVLAAFLAVGTRAHVPLAAAATLVTNPLTFPAIYVAAYNVGTLLLAQRATGEAGELATGVVQAVIDVSAPTALGLIIFALAAAPIGYFVGVIWWRSRLVQRWRRKQAAA